MHQPADIPAWIAFFLGLYALAAGVGEIRAPGGWNAVLADFERSPALRLVLGFVCLAVGGAIYLSSPWTPGDWLAIAVNILGGIAVAEGVLILAAGDRYLLLARRLLDTGAAAWAGLSVLFGMAALVAALMRI